MTAYAILVAIDDRNLEMPHGPHNMEQEAAPQHEAPTDHNVAADGRRSAGIARTAPMMEAGGFQCLGQRFDARMGKMLEKSIQGIEYQRGILYGPHASVRSDCNV
jgi:hypothetical protein